MRGNLIVGLSGGIATGKTSVARIFSLLGALIIDADMIARKVVEPKGKAWQEVVASFGEEVLNEDLSINRQRLAELAFSQKALLQRLNEITHPEIIAEIEKQLKEMQTEGRIIILDAPLLIEAGLTNLVDKLIVVSASEETQMERLVKRNGLTKKAVENRISAQMPLPEKIAKADIVIDNDGSEEELEEKVGQIWRQMNRLRGE